MSNNIFLSTTCFKNDNLEEIIKISKDNGITNLEISGGLKYIDEKKLSDLIEKNNDINFKFHNYFPIPKIPFVLNLASKKTSQKSVKNILKGINYASKYGKKIFSFHAGLRFNPLSSSLGKNQQDYKVINYDLSYNILEQSIKKIILEKIKDTTICIENNVVEQRNFINEENKYIFSDLSDSNFINDLIYKYNVKILLDFAHLKVSSKTLKFNPHDFIEEYHNNILIAHLSDNNGINDDGSILKKNAWFWKTVNWKKMKYISLELKNVNIDILKQQIELTSKMINT